MRIEPIRNVTGSHLSPRRPQEDAVAAESRALVSVSAHKERFEERPRPQSTRVDAALLAHLIATRDGLAQTRPLRRVSSSEGAVAYQSVRAVVKADPRPQTLGIVA